MSLFSWATRRVGGLSMIVLVVLCYYVITSESNLERHGYKFEHPDKKSVNYESTSTSGAGIWTFVFAYYCLFVHGLVFMFPLRACWSIWDIISSMKRNARGIALKDYKSPALRRRGSYASVSSSETLTSETNASTTTSEAGDVEPPTYTDGEELSHNPVIHAIAIPNYKEEMDTLKETLEVLASHPMARTTYDVYLGMEQREAEAESKALSLIQEFVKKFRSIDYTLHPSDIPGEAAGKGSNMAWCARKLSEKYPLEQRRDIIVTGIDSDSHLSANYFTIATDMHLSYPETAASTLYAAPIVFDRNAHKVFAMVRVADILWTAAGMSGLYRGSAIAPPTSVYSMCLELIDRVGGWDTDSEAIGEDLHMYLKSFFATNGHLTCRTIMSPVSQSNVEGGNKGGIRGAVIDLKARYKQALRHMWGALDAGYALRKGVEMWHERKHTTRSFRPLHQSYGDSADMYIPDNQLPDSDPQTPRESGIFSDVTQETIKEPHLENIFYVYHRMYEAHIIPVHMSILVVASALYMFVTDGNEDPNNLNWCFHTSNVLRTVGFMLMGGYMFLYESFHQLCVETRETEMKAAGLSEGMGFSHRSWKKNFWDYLTVPLVAPLYSSIPCIQAELSHFWTIDLVYTVSKKATRQQRQRARSFAAVADMA